MLAPQTLVDKPKRTDPAESVNVEGSAIPDDPFEPYAQPDPAWGS
jgi:hypothetical protein